MGRHRKHAPVQAAMCRPASPPVWRRILTLPLVPEAVRQTRRDTAAALSEYGLSPDSAFAGAVLLVVSELVSNAVRHAAGNSATVDVTFAIAAERLVIGVADQDPHLPDLAPQAMGEGLRTVSELTAAYGGALSVEAAVHSCGKTMLVWFALPDDQGLYGRRSHSRAL